jgi:hypothetical protein
MPFYRLATLDPSCAAEGGADSPTAIPPFLTEWLVLGPFENRGDSGVVTNFVNVPQLTASSAAEGNAERRWIGVSLRDAFVNLATALSVEPAGARARLRVRARAQLKRRAQSRSHSPPRCRTPILPPIRLRSCE